MTRYIVTANRLNKRNAIPENLPNENNIVGEVKKGFLFFGEEVTHVPNPSLGKWYKDRDGHFYWGGGIRPFIEPSAPIAVPAQSALPWWIKNFGIDTIWKSTKGENITVAVIDTGLNFKHSNIAGKKNISYFNIFNNSTNPDDSMDVSGHGTRCAGVIAAQGPDVFGIAPAARLIVIKAVRDNAGMICGDLAKGIDQAVVLGANIISVSYDFVSTEQNFDSLQNSILQAGKKNVLIVACTGNGGSSLLLSDTFPASSLLCLGVGACHENRDFWKSTTMNNNIDVLAPGVDIKLLDFNSNGTLTDSGTSYSTPYIAGLCALLMSQTRNLDLIRNIIKQESTDKQKIKDQISSTYHAGPPEISNLGIVNPLKTFQMI